MGTRTYTVVGVLPAGKGYRLPFSEWVYANSIDDAERKGKTPAWHNIAPEQIEIVAVFKGHHLNLHVP